MRTVLATLLATPLLVPQPARPGDVGAYVTRLRDCNHWGGEDATDAARRRAIRRPRRPSAGPAMRTVERGSDSGAEGDRRLAPDWFFVTRG